MIERLATQPFPPLAGFLVGLVLGSFVNTVVDRLPRGLSLIAPRSYCPGCHRTLSWWELVPGLSYLILRGRCRTCGRPVGPRTLLVELAAGVLGGLAALKLGLSLEAAVLLALMLALLALGVIDLERGILPDRITWPLLAGGLIWTWASGGGTSGGPARPGPLWHGLPWSVAGALLCGGLVWLVGLLYRLLRGRPGLGGGDPKLAAGLGAWLGPQTGLAALALGAGAGAAFGLVLMALGRAKFKTALPLGPFLAFGGIVWALLS